MSKIVVVFGATGNQGSSVVNSILGDPEAKAQFTIRGVTRDANSAKAKALAEKGVEPVQADLDDPASLVKVLTGAYAAFVVTDFWAHLSKDKEVAQGHAVADAAKQTNLQHLIFSSLPNVCEATNGALPGVLHFDSKALVEEYIRSIGIPATFFQPGMYMSNVPGNQLRQDPATGLWKISWPMPGNRPLAMFDAIGDTGKFVKAILLNREALLGKRVPAAAEYITPEEMIAQFKAEYPNAGKDAIYAEMPREQFKKVLGFAKLPEIATEDLTQMFEWFGRNGYFNGESLGLEFLKEKPTTWAEFIKTAPALEGLD